jgi:signal transduction histidine kinase
MPQQPAERHHPPPPAAPAENRVENQGAGLHFTVRDIGIGIPHEQLGQIFDRFEQAHSSHARQYSGVGLGLSIYRQLVATLRQSLSGLKDTAI